MSIFQKKFMPLAIISVFATTGAAVVACGDDDTSTVTPDASVADTGTDTGADAGKIPVFTQLGATDAARYAAVQGLVTKIIAAEKADCAVGPYFTLAASKAGAVKQNQIEECLSQQLATYMGAPSTVASYPTTVFAGTPDNYTCRAMGPAHAGLHIPEAVYNRFLTIALGAVTGAAPSLADQIKTALSPNLLVTDKQAIVETGATPLVPFGGDAGAPTGDAGDAGADGAAPVVCK